MVPSAHETFPGRKCCEKGVSQSSWGQQSTTGLAWVVFPLMTHTMYKSEMQWIISSGRVTGPQVSQQSRFVRMVTKQWCDKFEINILISNETVYRIRSGFLQKLEVNTVMTFSTSIFFFSLLYVSVDVWYLLYKHYSATINTILTQIWLGCVQHEVEKIHLFKIWKSRNSKQLLERGWRCSEDR